MSRREVIQLMRDHASLDNDTDPNFSEVGFNHILHLVFRQPENSELERALRHAGYSNYEELLAMNPTEIDALVVPAPTPTAALDTTVDTPSVDTPVKAPHKALIRCLQGFLYYREHVLERPLRFCTDITPEDFGSYRSSSNVQIYDSKSIPEPVIKRPTRTPAENFERNLKIAVTDYPVLKDDRYWDEFNRQLLSTARLHGTNNVLDPAFKPVGSDAKALFDKHKAFLYQVFVTNLKTDTGKLLVRQHQSSYDAQAIYSGLLKHATTSVKADTTASILLTSLTTSKLDSSWRGDHYTFIINWLDIVRKYHSLVPVEQCFHDDQLLIMLQNAVSQQPHLAQVKSTLLIMASTSSSPPSYDNYVSLLKAAAQTYDSQRTSRPSSRSAKLNVYNSDVYDLDDSSPPDLDPLDSYDIDTPVTELSAFAAARQPRPKLPHHLWQQLDDDGRRAWHQLPNSVKAIVLQARPPAQAPAAPTPPPPPPPPSCRVNLHDISAAEFLSSFSDQRMGSDIGDALTPPSDDKTNDSPDKLLAHVTNQKHLQPGDLQRLMSDKLAAVPANNKTKQTPNRKANKHDVISIGDTDLLVLNHSIIYSIKNTNTVKGAALVDRGANGCISGNDVRVIEKTHRIVNVQGLDNHQVTNIPIVTSVGITQSQRGPVIVVMHQAAHTGKGPSILSSGQLEHFGIVVDDKSSKVGGKQQISTPDGFVFPLNIKHGLPYLNLRPPTDRELSSPDIPHVVLTADGDWDPSILDTDLDFADWKHSIPEDDDEENARPFDQVGILKSNNSVVKLYDDVVVDRLINILQQYDALLPSDAYFEAFPRPLPSPPWQLANMADIVPIMVPHDDAPPMPPEFEVYEVNRRPSVLFDPGQPISYNLEATFPIAKDPPPHAEPNTTGHKTPPERHSTDQQSLDAYFHPSTAIKSRDPDWEKLRQYFAWLPKLVIQKTFDVTTQLARIPMSTHIKRHYRSPFPALNAHA